MIKVTATKFRNNLFGYLDKVAKGETIAIQRNKQEVARLISPPKADWRENISSAHTACFARRDHSQFRSRCKNISTW
jgi:prevent-host-death family protein